MKKIFTILTFLILFLPMWQMCRTVKAEAEEIEEFDYLHEKTEEVVEDVTIEKNIKTSIEETKLPKSSLSGYDLIYASVLSPAHLIETIMKNEFEFDDLTMFGACFSFFSYTLISIILVIFAFIKKKKRHFFWFSTINLCVIITSYFLFLYISNDIYQIKYGFYLLIINSLLIFYSNFKKIKSKNSV